MNLQEAFDTSAAHLLRQNARSVYDQEDSRSVCYYRTPSGRKCAIGALIPDVLYRRSFENKHVREIMTMSPEVAAHIMTGARGKDMMLVLLEDLRRLHDGSLPDLWRTGLLSIAATYGLNVSVLDNTKREVA